MGEFVAVVIAAGVALLPPAYVLYLLTIGSSCGGGCDCCCRQRQRDFRIKADYYDRHVRRRHG